MRYPPKIPSPFLQDASPTGDVAITTNGVHMLAYLGGEEWIQADPGPMKVVALNGRTAPNAWFDQEVALFRWREISSN